MSDQHPTPPPSQPDPGQWGQQPPPPQQPGGWQQPPPQQGGGWQQPPPGGAQPPPQQGGWQQPPPPQQGGWQQPPPQQGGWQQQPGPYGGPQGSGRMEPWVPWVAYLLGWIGGLIVYFSQKDPDSRFHGAQSILLAAPIHLLQIIFTFILIPALFTTDLGLISVRNSFGDLLYLLFFPLLSLAFLGLAIYLAVQASQGKRIKLPVIGDMAERWAAKPA